LKQHPARSLRAGVSWRTNRSGPRRLSAKGDSSWNPGSAATIGLVFSSLLSTPIHGEPFLVDAESPDAMNNFQSRISVEHTKFTTRRHAQGQPRRRMGRELATD
jgi:hypothetical protein